eukprot:3758614-Rhodomonas_salina.2
MVVGLTTSLVLNTSADQAWKLFGENFGEHSAWSAAIKSSALDREAIGVGAVRTIDDKTLGPNTVQIITHFDREAMVIGWKFGCPPAPIVAITNQWKFEAVDATHCRGISDATVQRCCGVRQFLGGVGRRDSCRGEAGGRSCSINETDCNTLCDNGWAAASQTQRGYQEGRLDGRGDIRRVRVTTCGELGERRECESLERVLAAGRERREEVGWD